MSYFVWSWLWTISNFPKQCNWFTAYHSPNSFAAKPPPGIKTPLAPSATGVWLPGLPPQVSSLLSNLFQSNCFSNGSPKSLSNAGVVRYLNGFLENEGDAARSKSMCWKKNYFSTKDKTRRCISLYDENCQRKNFSFRWFKLIWLNWL